MPVVLILFSRMKTIMAKSSYHVGILCSQLNQILKRETALATAAIYDSMFAAEDGTIPATFQVIENEIPKKCLCENSMSLYIPWFSFLLRNEF